MSVLERRLTAIRDREREHALLRRCPNIAFRRGPEYELDGTRVIGFCSNDYLGLAQTPSEAAECTGAGASRLVAGDLPLHKEVEASLAELVGTQAAVVFPSGYQLNVGVLPSLVHADDAVYSDERNHASLIDGLRLSAATPTILPHLCPPPTPESRDRTQGANWWVTESIFSMDGDGPSLEALRQHAGRDPLYLDEAHALGLFEQGRGRAPLGLGAACLVGTLGKALGCAGAFVAGSQVVCDHIRTHARSFVFSTAVSPLLLRAVLHAIAGVQSSEGESRRTRLRDRVRQLRTELGSLCPDAPTFFSPIVPIMVGSNQRALQLSDRLRENGLHVQAIRPPTVPDGTARLRVTLTSEHSPEHITALASALSRSMAQLPLAPTAGQT